MWLVQMFILLFSWRLTEFSLHVPSNESRPKSIQHYTKVQVESNRKNRDLLLLRIHGSYDLYLTETKSALLVKLNKNLFW